MLRSRSPQKDLQRYPEIAWHACQPQNIEMLFSARQEKDFLQLLDTWTAMSRDKQLTPQAFPHRHRPKVTNHRQYFGSGALVPERT